jgi:hypothetical protein
MQGILCVSADCSLLAGPVSTASDDACHAIPYHEVRYHRRLLPHLICEAFALKIKREREDDTPEGCGGGYGACVGIDWFEDSAVCGRADRPQTLEDANCYSGPRLGVGHTTV